MLKQILMALCLSGCVSHDVSYKQVSFRDIPGWTEDSMLEAVPALKRSCQKTPGTKMCQGLLFRTFETDEDVREFVEEYFTPRLLASSSGTTGLITGYYEASLTGTRSQTAPTQVPIYGWPENPSLQTKTREEIEQGPFLAPIIAWADDPVDLFILHIQGSGRLMTPTGEEIRLGYAGNNGWDFKGIGSILKEEGLMAPGMGSMPAMRAWLQAHPKKAKELMQKNPRYIFFKEIYGESPIGAAGVVLTPERTLAVDTAYTPLNTPLFLVTTDPDGRPIRRLMVTADTGADIKGAIRGDYFWGHGEKAFSKAGRMKNQGSFFVLWPKN